MSEINAQIKIWSDTAANVTSANPTLASGQWAKESDTGKVKLGDGSTAWTSLGYYSQTYETGTWIPTFTGFSSAPTVNIAQYVRIGKLCTAHLRMVATTSNATGFTVTLPFTASNTDFQSFLVPAVDNGAFLTSPAKADTTANSNILTLYKTIASAAASWTASGTKAANFAITYLIEE
jgi:hypothetical protein